MDKRTIDRTWRNLIVPFVLGAVLMIVALLCHRLGSKRPGPQTFWFFAGVLGVVLVVFPGAKMLGFRRYLKSNERSGTQDQP